MRIVMMVATLILMALAVAGCGGGTEESSEKLFHFEGFDISEADWRAHTQSVLLLPGADDFCKGIKGVSAKEVAEAVTLGVAEPGSTPPAGAIPTTREAGVQTDREAAARIIQEECERISQP